MLFVCFYSTDAERELN